MRSDLVVTGEERGKPGDLRVTEKVVTDGRVRVTTLYFLKNTEVMGTTPGESPPSMDTYPSFCKIGFKVFHYS